MDPVEDIPNLLHKHLEGNIDNKLTPELATGIYQTFVKDLETYFTDLPPTATKSTTTQPSGPNRRKNND